MGRRRSEDRFWNGSFSGEMMKVYELTLVEGQEWAMPKVLGDNNLLSDLRGQRTLHWAPIDMDILTEDDQGTPRRYSDFPWYGSHVLVLRSVAADALRKTMRPHGEFLPLNGIVGLELFNATIVSDALDEDRSEVMRFDDGDILTIDRYVFRQEAILNCPIFKLPYRASNLYFEAGFIDQIKDMGCCGVGFKLVWSDEIDPVREVILPPRERPPEKKPSKVANRLAEAFSVGIRRTNS